MGWVAVGPLERFGALVVGAGVTHDFAGQVIDSGKDSSGDEVTLDLGKPELHLIEPGRISRSEMKMN